MKKYLGHYIEKSDQSKPNPKTEPNTELRLKVKKK